MEEKNTTINKIFLIIPIFLAVALIISLVFVIVSKQFSSNETTSKPNVVSPTLTSKPSPKTLSTTPIINSVPTMSIKEIIPFSFEFQSNVTISSQIPSQYMSDFVFKQGKNSRWLIAPFERQYNEIISIGEISIASHNENLEKCENKDLCGSQFISKEAFQIEKLSGDKYILDVVNSGGVILPGKTIMYIYVIEYESVFFSFYSEDESQIITFLKTTRFHKL
jgi:hypothetical protein